MTETWLSAQGDEAKTVELAPSGFGVKSFPRQSRSRGGGIATVCKSTLGFNITFKTNFDFIYIMAYIMPTGKWAGKVDAICQSRSNRAKRPRARLHPSLLISTFICNIDAHV